MDYELEIMKLINHLETTNDYLDLKNDFDRLHNMRITNNYNVDFIHYIRKKYDDEIKYISQIRSNRLAANNISPRIVNENDYISECDFLINMLNNIFAIRLYRDYCSDIVSMTVESKLVTDDLKLLYEELLYLIKNAKK